MAPATPVLLPRRRPRRTLRAASGVGVLIAVAALTTACGDDGEAADSTSSPAASASAGTAREAAAISASDAWVKAVDSGMTAAFGTISNSSGADITIVSATTPASSRVELHETVMNDDGTMAMQPKDGGFVVPAGGSLTLEPGGNHIMFMDVADALKPGDTVPVTLTLSDGSTMEIDAVVKTFSGADENYQGGEGMDGMEGMGEMDGMSSPSPSEKDGAMHQHADGSQHDHSGS